MFLRYSTKDTSTTDLDRQTNGVHRSITGALLMSSYILLHEQQRSICAFLQCFIVCIANLIIRNANFRDPNLSMQCQFAMANLTLPLSHHIKSDQIPLSHIALIDKIIILTQ